MSAFLGLRQLQEALRQLSGPLRQTRCPLWCFAQHLAAFAWLCITLFGSCVDLAALSLPLYLSILIAPQLQLRSLILSLLANPALENRMTDHLVYPPSDPQASSYTFPVDISTAEIKSLMMSPKNG